jgi:CHASE3 domain sensor protein
MMPLLIRMFLCILSTDIQVMRTMTDASNLIDKEYKHPLMEEVINGCKDIMECNLHMLGNFTQKKILSFLVTSVIFIKLSSMVQIWVILA